MVYMNFIYHKMDHAAIHIEQLFITLETSFIPICYSDSLENELNWVDKKSIVGHVMFLSAQTWWIFGSLAFNCHTLHVVYAVYAHTKLCFRRWRDVCTIMCNKWPKLNSRPRQTMRLLLDIRLWVSIFWLRSVHCNFRYFMQQYLKLLHYSLNNSSLDKKILFIEMLHLIFSNYPDINPPVRITNKTSM